MIIRNVIACMCLCNLFLINRSTYAQPATNIDVLVAKVQNASFGIGSRLDAVEKLTFHYNQILGLPAKADSTAMHGIALAQATKNVDAQLRAYQIFFQEAANEALLPNKKNLLQEYIALAENTKNYKYLALSTIALSHHQSASHAKNNALKSAQKALAYAEKSGELEIIVLANNHCGFTSNDIGDNVSGLRYYLSSLDYLSLNSETNALLRYQTLRDFSYFYLVNEIFEKARSYNKLSIEELHNNLDSFYFYEGWVRGIQIEVGDPKGQIDFVQLESFIKETLNKGYFAVHRDLWALYRSFLISNEQYQQLYKLYKEQYPEEIIALKKNLPNVFWRVKAFFNELEGNLDSAQYYWNKTLADSEAQPNIYQRAHIYVRAGQFNMRIKNYEIANQHLEKGFELSKSVNYIPFMMEALDGLEQLDLIKGTYHKAYERVKLKKELSDSLDRMNQEKKLLALEFEHTALMLKNKRESEVQEQARKLEEQARITLYFGIGTLLFMILSALIFYSYRQTKRERKMSEALLLNILPADTASELKANGTTTARAYTNVTILFADIIGFSLVAEKLDATALISELDTYFREFDHIMQENGLEKIKTVGDAYLAVAGLPNDNKATAADVMRAAIAMQAYVHKMKKSRIKENRPYFELRIGLHTGSVVAGVVGFKKFQFDIWGDAVNIAARMEQSSAAGKINVSEDTYEQLKNEFKFIHRGKILAKNKGELSMYFYVVDEYEVADA